MQFDHKETSDTTQSSKETTETKQHLINDEKYNLLKECQNAIYVATESSPSMRKIINELIMEENLQKIKSKFIRVGFDRIWIT
jgi:hypothetical protein